MPKYGAYSKEIVLARPDKRSREYRLLWQMRHALLTHLGGEENLTAPRRVLVERAAMLQLRCAVLDKRIMDQTFTELDSRTYLAFNNSLVRTLNALGLDGPITKTTAPSITNYLGDRDADLTPQDADLPPAPVSHTRRERERLDD